MGQYASRTSNSGSSNLGLRGSRSFGGYSKGSERDAYNNSSLAVEEETEAMPSRVAEPEIIPKRYYARGTKRDTAMFQGLDEACKRGRRGSTTFSFILHIGIIAGVLWLATVLHSPVVQPQQTILTPLHFTLYDPPPPIMPIDVVKVPTGGGGGGAHHLIAPKRAPMPKVVRVHPMPMARPIIHVEQPKLTYEPSAPVRMQDNSKLASIGMPQSPQIALASQGSGSAGGFGFGAGGGFGSGHGNGMGQGTGGSYGGGVMSVGGGVSAPQVIHSVEPDFTDEARRSDFQGMASIQLIVDSQGNPQNVHVVRHLGMGLDEKAVEAVRQYRFKPAMFQGHPVAVQMVIEVDFRLH
jgi:protein TonB